MRIPLMLALGLGLAAPAAAQSTGWAMLPAVKGLDLDGDLLLSPEEIGGTRLPAEFDLDGDGLLSVVELSQGLWAIHDADDSGLLEEDEIMAMRGFAASGRFEYEY